MQARRRLIIIPALVCALILSACNIAYDAAGSGTQTAPLTRGADNAWGLETGIVGYAVQGGHDWLPAGSSYLAHMESAETITGTGCGGAGCSADPNLSRTIVGDLYAESDGIHVGSRTGPLAPNSGLETNTTPNGWVLVNAVVEGCLAIETDHVYLDDVLFKSDDQCYSNKTGTAQGTIANGNGDPGTARDVGLNWVTLDDSMGVPAGSEGAGPSDNPDRHAITGSGFDAEHIDAFGYGKDFFTVYNSYGDPTVIADSYLHDSDYAEFSPPACNHADPIFVWGTGNLTIHHDYINSLTPAGIAQQSAGLTEGCGQDGITGAVFFNSSDCSTPCASNDTVEDSYLNGETGKDLSGGGGLDSGHPDPLPCVVNNVNTTCDYATPFAEVNNALDGDAQYFNYQLGGETFTGNYDPATGNPITGP